MSTMTEGQKQHIHEIHEHLQHASTTDSPEEIRERMRLQELARKHAEEHAESEKEEK